LTLNVINCAAIIFTLTISEDGSTFFIVGHCDGGVGGFIMKAPHPRTVGISLPQGRRKEKN
jgi:hypothetical protein